MQEALLLDLWRGEGESVVSAGCYGGNVCRLWWLCPLDLGQGTGNCVNLRE